MRVRSPPSAPHMERKNIVILAVWILFPPLILLLVKGTFFLSTILYLVLPSVYFSLKRPTIVLKAFIVSLLSIPLMIVLDYLAFFNKAWAVPSIFPFRLLHLIPLEDLFFTFWAVYAVIVTFNYFFPQLYSRYIDIKRLLTSVLTILAVFCLFIFLYLSKQEIFYLPYYDTWLLVLIFVVPMLILFFKYQAYRRVLLAVMLYELMLFLPYEIVAGHLGFWTFPSNQYLGMIHLFGWTFPIEEFLEWMLFFAPATIALSEFITSSKANIKTQNEL